MTSKEAFEEIIKVCNYYHRKISNFDCETVCGYPIKNIEKDLEVLEILKEGYKDAKVIAYDTVFTAFFKEYQTKVKELYPLFISLPFNDGDAGKALSEMKESIRKSIGIDLL